MGLNQSAWENQVTHFAKTHQVITYETLRHGGTKKPSNNANLAEYSNQLLALMDFLTIDKASIIGHSMGALMALDFALTYSERSFHVGALSGVFMRGETESEAVLARVKQSQLSGIDGGRQSHYQTIRLTVPDAPADDEIIESLGVSIGGHPLHRISDRYEDLREMGHDVGNPAGI